MASILPVEPGIFWRLDPVTGKPGRFLSISYQHGGKTRIESAKTTSVVEARKLRARRVVADADGAAIASGTLTVADLLARLEADYVASKKPSLSTLRSHLPFLLAAFGAKKAKTLDADDITAAVARWQVEPTGPQKDRPPLTNATINRRLEFLRTAFNRAIAQKKLASRPAITLLGIDDAIIGKYLPVSDRIVLSEYLPKSVATFMEFACLYGTRRGQLAKVERAWVNAELRLITWPPKTTKRKKRAHQIPLDGRGWVIVAALLAEERPWCPYLFHGTFCRPGRPAGKVHACIGNFKHSWARACRKAGLPVGRRAGGPLFHDTRNTAVTDLLAGGVPIHEAMKISGHETTSMIAHYDMGNVEALRQRVAASRDALAALGATESFADSLHRAAKARGGLGK